MLGYAVGTRSKRVVLCWVMRWGRGACGWCCVGLCGGDEEHAGGAVLGYAVGTRSMRVELCWVMQWEHADGAGSSRSADGTAVRHGHGSRPVFKRGTNEAQTIRVSHWPLMTEHFLFYAAAVGYSGKARP